MQMRILSFTFMLMPVSAFAKSNFLRNVQFSFLGREPCSRGYGSRLYGCEVVSLNLSARYYMNRFHICKLMWLWEKTNVPKVVGSNPDAVYWTDITFFRIDLL